MSDLSDLTDLELRLQKKGADISTVDVKPYSEWSADVSLDPTQSRVQYANYLRESYIGADTYSREIEGDIRRGLQTSLVQEGVADAEDDVFFNDLYKPQELGFDEKVNMIQSTIGYEDADWETVTRYKALKKVVDTREDIADETRFKLEESHTQVESIVQERFDDVKELMVRNNELPFAFVKGEEGESVFIAGDLALKMSVPEAIKASKVGGVGMADAYLAQEELSLVAGTNTPVFKFKRLKTATEMILALAETDESLRLQINGHGTRLAESEYDNDERWKAFLDDSGQDITDGVGFLMEAGKKNKGYLKLLAIPVIGPLLAAKRSLEVGKEVWEEGTVAKQREERAAIARAGNTYIEDAVKNLQRKLNESGSLRENELFSLSEISAAYKQVVLNDANQNKKFVLHEKDDEVGKNIRTYGFLGPVVHPAAMANKNVFDKMLAARPDISDELKGRLKQSRVAHLEATFTDTSELLLKSDVGDDWADALTEGRLEGKKNHEILGGFLADEENYSAFAQRAKGLGQSVSDSFMQLILLVPATVFKSEKAQDSLVKSARASSDRRQLANLFGDDFGFWQDVGEAIIPMTVDVAATTVLATVSAGAGGVAYMSAKQGARLTTKGILKGITTSALRATTEEGIEKAAASALARNLIKESVETGGKEGAMKAIRAYNSAVAQKFGMAVGTFVPAASRSGAATYGSIFHALSEQDPTLSRAEIHDRALGAAITTGAITGFITSAFSALGRGGVESALLQGASFKNIKSLMTSMANTSGIKDDVVKAAMKAQLAKQLASYKTFGLARNSLLARVARGGVDEFQEEGLQQFISTFVEDAAMHENTPMLERITQSLYAGAIGGVLGGGVPAIQRVGDMVKANRFDMSHALALEQSYVEGVAARLEATGSPLTAAEIRKEIRTRARSREGGTRPTGAPTAETVGTGSLVPPVAFEAAASLAAMKSEYLALQEPVEGESDEDAAERALEANELKQAWEEENGIDLPPSTADWEGALPLPTAPATTQTIEYEGDQPAGAQGRLPVRTESGRVRLADVAEEGVTVSLQTAEDLGTSTIDAAGLLEELNENTDPETVNSILPESSITGEAELLALGTNGGLLNLENYVPATQGEFFAEVDYGGLDSGERSNLSNVSKSDLIKRESARLQQMEPQDDTTPEPPTLSSPARQTDKDKRLKKTLGRVAGRPEKRPPPRKPRPYTRLPFEVTARAGQLKIAISTEPFAKAGEITPEEKAEAKAVSNLARDSGFPLRFSGSAMYGLPLTTKNMAAKSDFMAASVYSYYPVTSIEVPPDGEMFRGTKRREIFDAQTGTKKKTRIKGAIDANGYGIFNNDPIVMAEMLSHNLQVKVPEGFDMSTRNPSIQIQDGMVVDVVRPDVTGKILESASTQVHNIESSELNLEHVNRLNNIPFTRADRQPNNRLYPETVFPIDPQTGMATSGMRISFGEMDQQLGDFLLAATAEPDPDNIPAARAMIAKGRDGILLQDDTIPISAGATVSEFVHLLRLFDLRAKFLSGKLVERAPEGYAISREGRRPKDAVRKVMAEMMDGVPVDHVARTLLPFVDVEPYQALDAEETIIAFIEQRILNYKDFRGDAMPSLDMIAKRSRARYAEQEKARGAHKRNSATVSLPSQEELSLPLAEEVRTPELEGHDRFGYAMSTPKGIDPQQFESFARDIGGLHPDVSVSAEGLHSVVTNTVGAAIAGIESDETLRAALNDLAYNSVFSPTPANRALVEGMAAEDLMGLIGNWIGTGNNTSRQRVLRFKQKLESGGLEAGLVLRDAFYLTALTYRTEGTLEDNPQVVEEVTRLIERWAPEMLADLETPTLGGLRAGGDRPRPNLRNVQARVRQFVKSLDAVLRERTSRSHITDTIRPIMREANSADVARLGLVSGDPDSAVEALRRIAKTSDDPSHKLVAELLLEDPSFIQRVEFVMDSNNLEEAGKYYKMADGRHLVYLNLASGNGRGLTNVFLEEYVHAFLSDTLTKPDAQLTPTQRLSKARLQGLFTQAKDKYNASGEFNAVLRDGLENLDEFVAHFLLSPDFQKYVVNLSPQGKRNIFKKLCDIFVGMFRKLTGKESRQYSDALRDIVDLGRSTFRSGTTNMRAMAASVSHSAAVKLKSANRQSKLAQFDITLRSPVAEESDVRDAIEDVLGEEVEILDDPVDAETFYKLMDFLKSRVPFGMELRVDLEATDAVAYVRSDENAIYISPQAMLDRVAGKDPVSARVEIASIISEEIGHTASFNALDYGEILAVIESVSDEEFEGIAREYYGSEATAEDSLARLRSDDPNEVAREKYILIEEKLRMNLQKVLRGYTTEEDYEFWSSQPNVLQMLLRYLRGAMHKFAASRTQFGGPMDAALNKLIHEYRAIEMGFVRQPAELVLDLGNPASSVTTYADITTYDYTAELLHSAIRTAHQDRTADKAPMSAHNILYSDTSVPDPSEGIRKNEDVGDYLKQVALEFWGQRVDSSNISPEQLETITQLATEEFEAAFHASGKNASDWYSTAIEVALGVASVIHPELADSDLAGALPAFEKADNPAAAADLTMRMALAITSQNLSVSLNTRFANEQYTFFRENGRFDPTKVYGEKADSISSNLQLANEVIESFGFEGLSKFLQKDFKVSELETAISRTLGRKVNISGTKNEVVQGAAIFGPKIGQGFLQNIMGNYFPVTIDLWLRRTWGRLTGDVVDKGVTPERLAAFLDAARESGIGVGPALKTIRTVTRKNKSGTTYKTVSADVVKRLETNKAFRGEIIAVAKELNSVAEAHYKMTRTPVTPEVARRLGASGFIGPVQEVKPDMSHKQFIRSQESTRVAIDKAFGAARAKNKKAKAAHKKRLKVWAPKEAKIRAALEAGKITEEVAEVRLQKAPKEPAPVPPKAEFVEQWYADNGRTVRLTKEEVNALRPEWARTSKVIADSLKPIDVPSNQDRRVISEVINEVRNRLEKKGYTVTNADVQAVLWFPEKDIWAKLRGEKESSLKSSYDDEFTKLAHERGVGDAADAIARRIRDDRNRRATRDRSVDDTGTVGPVRGETVQLGAVRRTGRVTRARVRYRDGRGTGSNDRGEHLTAEDFSAVGQANKAAHKFGTSVDVYPAEEYEGYELILLEMDGETATISISPQGEVGSVTKSAGANPKMVTDAFEVAIETGKVKWLNGFDTILPKIYSALGFKAVARLKFDPEYSPEGWDYEAYERFNKGKPDVVFMSYVGQPSRYVEGEGTYVADYDSAVETTLSQTPPALLSPARTGPPSGTAIDFGPVIKLLEMPMAEYGAYKAPKGWFRKVFQGEVDEPIRRLIEARDEFKRASTLAAKAYKKKMDFIINRDFDGYKNAPMDVIAAAQGHIDGNLVPEETYERIEKEHAERLAEIKEDSAALGREETLNMIALSKQQRSEEIEKAHGEAIAQAEAARDEALLELAKLSPDLAAHIIDIREKLIKPIQKKLIASGISPQIGIKIDATGGIYITRAYKMFTDAGYLRRIRTDPSDDYALKREAAMEFFEQDFLRKQAALFERQGDSPPTAKRKAEDKLRAEDASASTSYAQDMLDSFLSRYDAGSGGASLSPTSVKNYKILEDNLKQRHDLPKPIRELLGEYGPEVGTDLLVRTLTTVSTITAQQTFLSNLAEYGEKAGIMVDGKTRAADLSKYGKWVSIRRRGDERVSPDVVRGTNSDPLENMYVPADLKEALDATLGGVYDAGLVDTAEHSVGKIAGVLRNLTGKSMAAKTLGSVGFFMRNALGNILFFGPAQGIGVRGLADALKQTALYTGGRLKDPDKLDAELVELTGLGIIGDELRAGIMRELLGGEETVEGAMSRLNSIVEQTKLAKGKKAIEWLEKKAMDLSAGIDGAFKIAYYTHELEVLRKAARADKEGTYGRMTETQLKRAAARKVKMTAQSLSQAPPAVHALTQSGYGLLFAPFLRFKTEVPRIVINTYRLGFAEMADENPVIKSRGRKRVAMMSIYIGAISSAIPAVLAYLSGIGDDEDEALRSSMPEYLRGHTFFYARDRDGTLVSTDLTYLNPFSLLLDPVMRMLENVKRGEFADAASAFALGFIRDQYLDEQILAGTVYNAAKNHNPTTGKPIWNKGADEPIDVMNKLVGFVFKDAYQPRVWSDMEDALKQNEVSAGVSEFLEGVWPVRLHTVDTEKQFRRYLLDARKRMANVKSQRNRVLWDKPMTEKDIREVYDKDVADRRALNHEMYRVARGFEGLGMTPQQIYSVMTSKNSGVGKDRAKLLLHGYMDRPDISNTLRSLAEKEFGEERAQILINQFENYNRYLPIIDVDDNR
jgi:hypothetical protein